VLAAGPRVASDLGADALGERGVPGRGETNAAWIDGTRPVGAHAERTVGGAELRKSNASVPRNVEEVDAAEEPDLLFRREQSEKRVDAALECGVCGTVCRRRVHLLRLWSPRRRIAHHRVVRA